MALNPRQIAKLGLFVLIAMVISILIGTAVSFFAVMGIWAVALTILTIKSKYPVYKLDDVTYVISVFAILAVSQYPNSNLANGILIVSAITHIYLVFTNKNIEFNVTDFY